MYFVSNDNNSKCGSVLYLYALKVFKNGEKTGELMQCAQ